ncbi:MAG TPA: hypothetical protein VGC36_15300 [Rhizomicrobium sp.]
MKFVIASVASAFLLLAGFAPASAATAGAALVVKPSLGQAQPLVEKAGWGHRRWHRHRHYYRPYRWYRPYWGWRHRHWHHRHW